MPRIKIDVVYAVSQNGWKKRAILERSVNGYHWFYVQTSQDGVHVSALSGFDYEIEDDGFDYEIEDEEDEFFGLFDSLDLEQPGESYLCPS